MNFEVEYTTAQESFRRDVQAFLTEHVPGDLEFPVDTIDLSEDQFKKRRTIGRALGERGWLYPTMPKEYGGAALSVDEAIVLSEELSAIGLSNPPYYDAGGRHAAPSILVWGNDEQKQRFLPMICRGEIRSWQLLTEPGAGSDLAAVKTTAIQDGDHYVVNGQKVFVGSNHGADYSWTIAVTNPDAERHHNLSWFMIPMDLPGIEVVPMNLLTAGGGEGGGGCGVKNTVFFDDVRVPADHLVGGENNGWQVASTHLEVEHGGTGRVSGGSLVERFIDHCKHHPRGGEPLSKDPDVRESLVDIFIESEITRLFGLRNYWLAHADQPRSYEGSQFSLRRKLSGLEIAEKMLDIIGPAALTRDPEWSALAGSLEYYQRDAITALHPGATTDIQRVIISRRIGIGRPEREKAGALR